MRNMKNIMSAVKVMVLTFVLVAGVQASAQQINWSAPSSTAPANNTPAPLNVGIGGQTKAGGLTLNGSAGPATYGLIIPNGKVSIGSTTVPVSTEKLDVTGNINVSGCYKVNNGPCLTTGGSLPAGALNQTFRHNGSAWAASSNMFNTNLRVGIGTNAPEAPLHVTNVAGGDANGTIRISRPEGGYSTLQLYKQNGVSWKGWALVNDPENNFRINYDSTNNSSSGSARMFFQSGGNKNIGLGTEEGQYFDAKSKLMVGGKILVDLRTPTYGSDDSAHRDGFEMIVGGANTDRGRLIVNKPSFEFWSQTDGAKANLYTGNLYSRQIQLSGNGGSDVPAVGEVLGAVNINGTAEWKSVGAQGSETFYDVNTGTGRADCPPGSGKVVTGVGVVGGQVTGVWCKSLQAF